MEGTRGSTTELTEERVERLAARASYFGGGGEAYSLVGEGVAPSASEGAGGRGGVGGEGGGGGRRGKGPFYCGGTPCVEDLFEYVCEDCAFLEG